MLALEMKKQAQFDQVVVMKGLQAYLRYIHLDEENRMSPFQSEISRFVLDGARSDEDVARENDIDPENEWEFKDFQDKRKSDREYWNYWTSWRLVKPTQGALNAVRCVNSDIHYRSSLTRVIKDIIRGKRGADLHDYHVATRYYCPFVVYGGFTLYVAFEFVPFAFKGKDGKISNPRTRKSDKDKGVSVYDIPDRGTVLTIRWPDLPFLRDIHGPSPYPDDQDVVGTMRWREVVDHPFFSTTVRALAIEVQNENPHKHPAILHKDFLSGMSFSGKVRPISPGMNLQEFHASNSPDLGSSVGSPHSAPYRPSSMSLSLKTRDIDFKSISVEPPPDLDGDEELP